MEDLYSIFLTGKRNPDLEGPPTLGSPHWLEGEYSLSDAASKLRELEAEGWVATIAESAYRSPRVDRDTAMKVARVHLDAIEKELEARYGEAIPCESL